MSTFTLKRRGAMVISALAAGGLIASTLVSTAGADPRSHTDQVVGTGSDTTQEVMNAFAGEAAGKFYTPLSSPYGANGRTVISSWNATAPEDQSNPATCISPRAGFNAFQRPNGSGQGRAALSRSFDGQPLRLTNGDPACNAKATSGIVDFARSSSGPGSGTTTELTYIPFGRDALTYAITRVDGVPGDAGDGVGNLTLSFTDLQAIFKSGGQGITIGGVLYIPCDIQSGSGTRNDWPGKIGGGTTVAQVDTASTRCSALGAVGTDTSGKLQEHKANQLEAKADLFEAQNPNVVAQLLVGFSVSNFVAQANGAAPDSTHPDVRLGSAVVGQPATIGTAPNLVGNPCFYNPQDARDPSTTADDCPWVGGIPTGAVNPGRKVYNVLLSDTVTGPGNLGLKALFVGATSSVCQAGTTIERFGYTQLPQTAAADADKCGDTSVRGPLM